MGTSKNSSTNAKSGKNKKPDRQKGLAYYRSLLTLSEHNGDTLLANKCKAIIKWLEQRVRDEKEK
jgi:hypothetical protein